MTREIYTYDVMGNTMIKEGNTLIGELFCDDKGNYYMTPVRMFSGNWTAKRLEGLAKLLREANDHGEESFLGQR